MQLAEEIGVMNLEAYSNFKLIVNQVREEYEVRYEGLVLYYNTTVNMAQKFKNFYIDHVPWQQNAMATLAASLALPARATEKVLIHSHDLYCKKLALEDSKTPRGDLQVEEVLESSRGPKPRYWRNTFIDFVL